eukprot:6095115-Pleurochrysis_carterae.AAC.2
MEICADVGERILDTVMLVAELDVNAAMNAPVSQEDMAVALIKRMKHAFEVPQLLHDPGLTSAMRTTPLNFNVVVKNAFLCLRLWCSSRKQIQEFDDLCRYMTERHVSKYVSSTRGQPLRFVPGFAKANEVTEVFVKLIVAVVRYLEPENLVADFDGSSDSTFSDDDAGPSAEVRELAPESADAEPLEEASASSASLYARWERAEAKARKGGRTCRWKDIQALMDTMEARTKLNKA